MRKKLASKCFCIALAAAMVLGVSGPSYAAQTKDVTQTATVASTSSLEITSSYFSETNYGNYMSASAAGYGKDAYLYINGVEAASRSGYYDGESWSLYGYAYGRAGVSYTAKAVAYNSDHTKSVSKIVGTKKFPGIVIDSSNAKATVSGTSKTAKGYAKASSVSISVPFKESSTGYFNYEILRATSKKGKYTRIHAGEDNTGSGIDYIDEDIKSGKTYYYKVKIYSGTDSYVKTNKLLATSKIMTVNTGKPTVSSTYLSAYAYEMDAETGEVTKSKAGIYVSMSSDFANQYDIYRSTSPTKGFKRIRTVYVSYYMDTNIRAGKTYYYYVVPKYYNKSTRKTVKGNRSDIVAARYLMDNAWSPELTQVSKNSLKVEWGGVSQPKVAGVSYELWYKRTDIAGDAYRKAGDVTGKKFILKNLSANGTYEVRIKAVKKSGTKVLYEQYSSSAEKTLGYTDYVSNVEIEAKSSSVSSNKKTLNLNYKITWDRVWGASGYIITATDNWTGKTFTKKIASAKKTSYTLKNKSTESKGIRYTGIFITPYKAKTKTVSESYYYVDDLPESKKVKVRQSGTSAKVSWYTVKGASSYSIYRSTGLDSSNYQYLGESKKAFYVDKNVDPGMEYTYKVYANTSFGGVDGSNTYSDVYTHRLQRTRIVKATNPAKKTTKIVWKKVTGAKQYLVYRSTSKKGKYKVVGRTSKNTFTNKKLKKGETYYYKVVAVTRSEGGQVVKSAYSSAKAVKVKK